MKSLPKSGGWLNTVKVVLGFLEVGPGIEIPFECGPGKTLGPVEDRTPSFSYGSLHSLVWGLYLFGKIKFPHDSPIKKLGLTRIGLGVASFAFVIYLATGFIYDEKAGSFRSLKLLSGLAPPACYSIFKPCDCPQNLNCFKDFEEGLTYAKQANKPIMIDFYRPCLCKLPQDGRAGLA